MSDKIHVLTGSDEGLVSEKALQLFNQLKPEGGDEFSNDIIEGNAENAESAFNICSEVIQALQTLPFFSAEKIVWLKDANFFGSDRTSESERAKQGVMALIEVLESGVSNDVTFIISATTFHKGRAFYKFISKYAKVASFDKIDISGRDGQQKLQSHIKVSADKLGISFTSDALYLFVQLVGVDTRQIRNEIDKLDLYLGSERRVIELADVELMVPLTREGVIFEIGRALQNRNGIRALSLVDDQLASGQSGIAIMRAALIPTIRNLFMARLVIDNISPPLNDYNAFKASLDRFPEKELAWLPKNKAGAISMYPLFLAMADSKKFTTLALREAMISAQDIDMKLVTTALDPRVLLHKLIVELCTSRVA